MSRLIVEPPPYEIVNPDGRGRAILTCDHASRHIPDRLGTLGVGTEHLESHIAWDVGAAASARGLSRILDAPLILAGYSRLVVDPNRPLSAPEAFVTRSEDVPVPGNLELDELERRERAESFFWPYHDAVHEIVGSRAGSMVPVLISVHSFTPVYRGVKRPWDIGVLHRADNRLATLMLEILRADGDLCVGDNEPYRIALDEDYTVPIHAERRGIPYVMFEIRQDHLESQAGVDAWAERLGTALRVALTHPSLDGHGTRATDIHEPRYR